MIKKLLYLTLLLLLLFGAALGYAFYNLNSLIAQYKPDLERMASDAIGSKVTLGNLDVSVLPNPRVTVDQLRVTSTEQDSQAFTLNNFIIYIELMPLFSKKLDIMKPKIDKPEITMIKDADGVTIAGLPKKAAATPATTSPSATPAAAAPPLEVSLRGFEISNAAVTMKDTVAGKEYKVSGISLEAEVTVKDNVASVAPLSFSARLLDKIDLRAKGSAVTFELATGMLRSKQPLAVELAGNKIDLTPTVDTKKMSGTLAVKSAGIEIQSFKTLADMIPALTTFQPKGALAPELTVDFDLPKKSFQIIGNVGVDKTGAKVGQYTIDNAKGYLTLTVDKVKQTVKTYTPLTLTLNGAPVTVALVAEYVEPELKVTQLDIGAFSGKVSSQSAVRMDGMTFTSGTSITGLQMESAVAALAPAVPAKMTGLIESVRTDVRGSLDPDLMQSLAGTTSVSLKDATLKGVNIAGSVLKAVTSIPFLSGALFSSVPPEKLNQVASEDTKIHSLTGSFQIGGGGLTTKNLLVFGGFFTLKGEGRIGFDSNIDLKAEIIFDKEFSLAMAAKTKEITRILDGEDRLVIPLTLSGVVPKTMVLPNVKRLIELGGRNAVRDQAGKFLDRYLGPGQGKEGAKAIGDLFGF